MNIFVGNLDFRTEEDGIRRLFEPFGELKSVAVISDRETGRSRGFGFVEMSSNEDGQRAIQSLDGRELDGRALKVNEAKPREERPRGGGGGSYGGGGGRSGGGYGGGGRDRY